MTTTTSSASLYITQVRFCRALAVVRSLPTESGGAFQPSVADRLNFYGLYKQALAGDCMLLKPSSRNIVQYAKWKSWDRLRGVPPIDAQIMYIHALIDLLKEFLTKYPDSELTSSLNESLNYLQEEVEDTTTTNTDEEYLVQWDTNDQEKEEYYLGQIEKEQILNEQQPSLYSSPITNEFPMTPELSPRLSRNYNYNNGKSPQQQQQNQHYLYPPPTSAIPQQDEDDDQDDDLLDHEVATATSSLYLSTPSQHPYSYSSSTRKLKKRRPSSSSNRAIQTLQTEVAALCQEIDHLRKTKQQSSSLLRWRSSSSWLWLFTKSIAKHAFFNFLILLLVFFVLWRRKSPIALAVMNYASPRTRDLIRYLLSRTLYI